MRFYALATIVFGVLLIAVTSYLLSGDEDLVCGETNGGVMCIDLEMHR